MLNLMLGGMSLFLSTCFFEEKTPEDQQLWEYAKPAAVGMDNQLLLDLDSLIQSSVFGRVNSLIIIKDDHLVFENYYTGINRSTPQDISGISFAIASSALGLAIEDGLINSLDDEVRDYLPAYSEMFAADPIKNTLTFRHLMSMKSGISWNENLTFFDDPINDLNRMTISSDWVAYLLNKPSDSAPGTRYSFNSGAPIIIAKIVQDQSQLPYAEYLQGRLFDALDIHDYTILPAYGDYVNAAWGFSMRPIDLVKIGYVHQKLGAINNQQLLSADWIEESTMVQSQVSFQNDYGLFWWRFSPFNMDIQPSLLENDVYYATGISGQIMYVIPHQNMVVSIMVESEEFFAGQIPFVILKYYILPATL